MVIDTSIDFSSTNQDKEQNDFRVRQLQKVVQEVSPGVRYRNCEISDEHLGSNLEYGFPHRWDGWDCNSAGGSELYLDMVGCRLGDTNSIELYIDVIPCLDISSEYVPEFVNVLLGITHKINQMQFLLKDFENAFNPYSGDSTVCMWTGVVKDEQVKDLLIKVSSIIKGC